MTYEAAGYRWKQFKKIILLSMCMGGLAIMSGCASNQHATIKYEGVYNYPKQAKATEVSQATAKLLPKKGYKKLGTVYGKYAPGACKPSKSNCENLNQALIRKAAVQGGDTVVFSYKSKNSSRTKYKNGKCLKRETKSVPQWTCDQRTSCVAGVCTTTPGNCRTKYVTRNVCTKHERVYAGQTLMIGSKAHVWLKLNRKQLSKHRKEQKIAKVIKRKSNKGLSFLKRNLKKPGVKQLGIVASDQYKVLKNGTGRQYNKHAGLGKWGCVAASIKVRTLSGKKLGSYGRYAGRMYKLPFQARMAIEEMREGDKWRVYEGPKERDYKTWGRLRPLMSNPTIIDSGDVLIYDVSVLNFTPENRYGGCSSRKRKKKRRIDWTK